MLYIYAVVSCKGVPFRGFDNEWCSVVVSALASINVVNRHQLGPVTTWMGDCSQAGKPSGYITSHLGRLSLLPSVGWQNEYQLSG